MRHVVVHRIRQRANHLGPAPRGRLEEKISPVDTIHHPSVLSIDVWLAATPHAPDIEFRVDADLRELSPGPEREILTIAAAQLFEGAGMLPAIGFVEQIHVGRVPAAEQPVHDVIDGPHRDGALAVKVVRELLP